MAFVFSWSGKYSFVFIYELFSFWLCVWSLLFLELLLFSFFLPRFLLELSGVYSNRFYFLYVFGFFFSVDCCACFSRDLNWFICSVYSSDSILYLMSSSFRRLRLFYICSINLSLSACCFCSSSFFWRISVSFFGSNSWSLKMFFYL